MLLEALGYLAVVEVAWAVGAAAQCRNPPARRIPSLFTNSTSDGAVRLMQRVIVDADERFDDYMEAGPYKADVLDCLVQSWRL